LKLTFLRWRTESALRKNKSLRASTPYKRSNLVGIIFSVEDRQKHDDIKDFIRHLEQDGKQVKVMEFLPRKKDNYEFLFDFFTIHDLNFWGKIVNDQARKFAETPFDYLFYIDEEHNPLVLNLLAQSRAHCRVGRYQEGMEPYFEFMIAGHGTPKGLIDNMYRYTKQLR
jgi:hypothetical protein